MKIFSLFPHFLRQSTRRHLAISLLVIFSTNAGASELLFDGGFESGTLQGWIPGKTGSALVTRKGSCFSGSDTRGISIRGRYAGLLRSQSSAEGSLRASLTSKPFTAARGILFLALSEAKRLPTPELLPLALEISILDEQGNLLEQKQLSTAVVALLPGCPSGLADTSFSRHFFSTQAYAGETIRLRFSQHEETAAHGGFTLIDQVATLPSDSPALRNAWTAQAGLQLDPLSGEPYLLAQWRSPVAQESTDLQISWLINGEKQRRPYPNPCIGDLAPGHYTALLYIQQDEQLIATDTLFFSLPREHDTTRTPVNRDGEAGTRCNRTQSPLLTQ